MTAPEVADGAARLRRHRVRRVTTWVLVVLTALSVLAGTVAYWAHRTVFDEDRYLSLVVPLADDPAVKAALSTYLTDQIVTVLDLDKRIADAMGQIPQVPKAVSPLLAGPIANMGNELVAKEVTKFLDSREFRTLWSRINAIGHEKVVALLREDYDKLPNLKLEGDEVRINLLPIVSEVLQHVVQEGVGLVAPGVTVPDIAVTEVSDTARRTLSSVLGITVPQGFGELTIMSKQNLDDAQALVGRLDRLVWGLVLLSLALAVATVVVAPDRRRGLLQLALGVAVGLLLAAAAVREVKEELLSRVAGDQAREAAGSVVSALLATLRTVGWFIFVAAVVVGVVAYLAGRPRWLDSLLGRGKAAARDPRLLATVARNVDGFRVVGVAVALLVLVRLGLGVFQLLFVAAALSGYLWAVDEARKSAPAIAGAGAAPAEPTEPAAEPTEPGS